MSNYLKLEIGESAVVSLKYPTPRPVKNSFTGKDEWRWILADGRALFTPAEFRAELEALILKPGQKFVVSKVRDNGRVVFKCAKAQPAAELIERAAPLDAVVETPRIPNKLEHALKAAVRAAAAAEKHGEKIGYPIHFESRDIREMAISVLMEQESHAA